MQLSNHVAHHILGLCFDNMAEEHVRPFRQQVLHGDLHANHQGTSSKAPVRQPHEGIVRQNAAGSLTGMLLPHARVGLAGSRVVWCRARCIGACPSVNSLRKVKGLKAERLKDLLHAEDHARRGEVLRDVCAGSRVLAVREHASVGRLDQHLAAVSDQALHVHRGQRGLWTTMQQDNPVLGAFLGRDAAGQSVGPFIGHDAINPIFLFLLPPKRAILTGKG